MSARCALAVLVLVALPALGDSDPQVCLDTRFADGGVFRLDVGARANVGWSAQGLDRTADGKWLVGGVGGTPARPVFLVLRLDDDGALDSSFGDGGVLELDVGPDEQELEAVRALPDGRVLLAGAAQDSAPGEQQIAFAVVDADGRGVQTFLPKFLPSPELLNGAVVLSDGGVLLGGHGRTRGADVNLVVLQVTAAGALEPSFGDGGIAELDFGAGDEFGGALALDPAGNVLVPGTVYGGADFDFGLVRLTPGGHLDPTFTGAGGLPGRASVEFFGGFDACTVVAAQSDGKPLCAGEVAAADGGRNVAVVRFTTTGALDSSFGDGGVALFDFGPGSNLRALAIRGDGLIVAGGSARGDAGDLDLLILALQPSGRVAFNGLSIRDVSGGRDELVHTLRYDPAGRLVAFAELGTDGGNDLGVLRLVTCPTREVEPLPGPRRRGLAVGCACSEMSSGWLVVSAALLAWRARRRNSGAGQTDTSS